MLAPAGGWRTEEEFTVLLLLTSGDTDMRKEQRLLEFGTKD